MAKKKKTKNSRSRIPKGMTEEEVVTTINKVVKNLAWKFRFGYHTLDDIKQQGRLEAWKCLDKYDNKRPLENFLWTHVRNRLFNFKRDNYERPDLPCLDCPFNAYDPKLLESKNGCKKFTDMTECHLYNNWSKRNTIKKNIMNPIELGSVSDEPERNMKIWDNVEQRIDNEELLRILNRNMPIEYKPDFIRLRYGIRLPKLRYDRIIKIIRQILDERGLDEPEAW